MNEMILLYLKIIFPKNGGPSVLKVKLSRYWKARESPLGHETQLHRFFSFEKKVVKRGDFLVQKKVQSCNAC